MSHTQASRIPAAGAFGVVRLSHATLPLQQRLGQLLGLVRPPVRTDALTRGLHLALLTREAVTAGANTHRVLQDQPPKLNTPKQQLLGWFALGGGGERGEECRHPGAPGTPVFHKTGDVSHTGRGRSHQAARLLDATQGASCPTFFKAALQQDVRLGGGSGCAALQLGSSHGVGVCV